MIAALFGVGVVTGGDEADQAPAEATAVPIAEVAERVERVRGLEFERVPPVRTVTGDEAREEGLAALDEDYPPAERAADERILILLGLLPSGADLRELAGSVFGEEVAGYYDERTGRMTIVEGATRGGDEAELTLAHELVHALEDQHFGLGSDDAGLDDERSARVALFEGTATVAMIDYAVRYLAPGPVARRDLLRGFDLVNLFGADTDLPPYLERSLVFPYAEGARFVDAIGTWGPANRALRGEPPVSTEQVLHPEKYRAGERPLPVAMPRPSGPGWQREAHGTIGEFDTAELIRSSDSPLRAERAAAGWGGGSYVLWESERVQPSWRLELAWRWDTRRDAAEFVAALPRYIERTLRARRGAGGVWVTPDGNTVTVQPGDTVRLMIGPAL